MDLMGVVAGKVGEVGWMGSRRFVVGGYII